MITLKRRGHDRNRGGAFWRSPEGHHKTIGPDLGPGLVRPFAQQIKTGRVVRVVEEDLLAPVAPLGHMVWSAGYNDARHPCHGASLAERGEKLSTDPTIY